MIYLLLVFVVVLVLIARKARPAIDQHGHGLISPPAQASPLASTEAQDVLRVATYNIQTGKSLAGKRDVSASAQVIAKADLVGVQEVYAPSILNSLGMGLSQSEQLAAIGRFDWLFCATRRRWFREHRGNAILSKLPVKDWRIKILPDRSRKSYRNLTVAEVEWQGRHFHFLNTHLHTKVGRQEQIEAVLREFAKYSPAILVGDFNCLANELNDALSDIKITDAIEVAKLADNEVNRIDWILCKGFEVVGGDYLEKGVSDHPYYQTNLRFKP